MAYYIRTSTGTSGPFAIHELKSQGITRDTLVITSYLYEWTKAGEVLQLIDLFTEEPAPAQNGSGFYPEYSVKQHNSPGGR